MNDSLSSSLSVRTENKMLLEKRLTPSLTKISYGIVEYDYISNLYQYEY